jgi:Arc/MetJ-type ribon-helix-helix transcriptional regulator
MDRIQILLEPTDRHALEQLAKERNTSMSNVVRDLLRERIKQQRRANMRYAAKMMADAYRTDAELTAFSALDSEDILDEAK